MKDLPGTTTAAGRIRCTFSASLFLPLLLILLVFPAGCTFNHNLEVAPKLDTLPASSKAPLTVGLYYSPELATYKHSRVYGPHRYIVPAGKESVALFDKLALMAFQNVVHLDGLPPFNGKAANVDVILEPDITAFHFRVGFEGYTKEQGVGYRLNVFSKEGIPLGSRTIFGQETPPHSHFYPWGHLEPDMQDAALKVLEELHRLPDIVSAENARAAAAPAFEIGSLTTRAVAVEGALQLTDKLSLPLAETGIVAIAVSVRNGSDRSISVSERNIRLVLPGGRTIASADISDIPSRLEQRSYAFEVGGILAAHGASEEERAKRAAIIDVLRQKAFGEKVLRKDESADGVVFFVPAEGTASFRQADLSIWYIDAETKSGIRASKPVSQLNFASGTDRK